MNKKSCNFIAVSLLCASLTACGGGGGGGGGGDPTGTVSAPTPTLAWNDVNALPNATLSNDVTVVRIAKMDNVFHEYSELHFTFRSNGYFRENTNGHTAVVMRGDLTPESTRVLGAGMVFGNVSGAINVVGLPTTVPNPLFPSVQIETWFNGFDKVTGNYLLTPKSPPPIMKDDVNYDVIIRSHILQDKSLQTEEITISENGSQIWDSGVINDPNKYIVPTMNDVTVGHVFETLSCAKYPNAVPCSKPWTIEFTKVSLLY